jgi:hypothetical protein
MTVRRLTTEQREALELLASDPQGATEQLLVVAHGFESDMIAWLVRSGLATATRESMKAGGKTIEVFRIRITEVGRKAIKRCPATRVVHRTDQERHHTGTR